MFKVNQEKFKEAVSFHNWRHPVTDIAKATGYTKAYVSMVLNGVTELSADFMSAYVEATGMMQPGKWAHLFDYVPDKKFPSTHHRYNWMKFYGIKPYRKWSSNGHLRAMDALTEFEEK